MDFSSQLANLERAASRGGDGDHGAHDRHHPHRHNKRPRHHSNEDRSPQQRRRRRHYYFQEHAMQKALVALARYRPRPSPPGADAPTNCDKTRPRHIALLFITIDDLPYEEIWKAWAMQQASSSDDNDNVMVSVVGHAKFPNSVKSSWLRQRLLVESPKMGRGGGFESPKYHTRRPEWGSIEITRAMLDVLHESLQIGTGVPPIGDERFSSRRFLVTTTTCDDKDIPPVDKFIFVSETCLPVTSLHEVNTALFGTNGQLVDESWVNASPVPNNGYARQLQFDKVDPAVPKHCVYKADQWMVLSRGHAMAVMDLDRHLPRGASLWQCFVETNASDELYFPTALALLGIVPSSIQVLRKRVTYADWSVSARNPASFTNGLQGLKQVAVSARQEGCLFARKFSPFDDKPGAKQDDPTGCITVDEWKECIEALATVQLSADEGFSGAIALEQTKKEFHVTEAIGTVAQHPTVEESQTGRGEEES